MKAIQAWRNLAIYKARANNIDAEWLKSIDNLLYWWLGSYSKKFEDEHIYLELRHCSSSLSWVVFGAVFSKSDGAASISVEPFVVSLEYKKDQVTHRIVFDALSPGHWHNFNCSLEVNSDFVTNKYEINNIHVNVSQGPRWKNSELIGQVITEIHEDFSSEGKDATDGVNVELPCPVCHGTGFKITFAIPKEDYASGLTGYELYSCNKINSTVACVTCGGNGVEYKDWYLKENPELLVDQKQFWLGIGIVEEQRLPRCGTLNNHDC